MWVPGGVGTPPESNERRASLGRDPEATFHWSDTEWGVPRSCWLLRGETVVGSVAVVVGLVGAVGGDAEVVGLLVGEAGQLYAQVVEV
jgi:hypothetical protein